MDKSAKYSFVKPTFLAFMGIPGSGKSTIAKKLNDRLNSHCYLEHEEDLYPDDIKLKFKNVDKDENIVDIHYYFRNMRAEYHKQAETNKKNKKGSILDSFYSKVMLDIIKQPNTDWFINSKNRHFNKIKSVSEFDSNNLSDADIVIFLNVTKDMHKTFLKNRNRECEVDERIISAQSSFYNATVNYAKRKNKKLIVVQQENNVDKVVNNIIEILKTEKVIH
jgi:thymidylate kinase